MSRQDIVVIVRMMVTRILGGSMYDQLLPESLFEPAGLFNLQPHFDGSERNLH